MKKSIFTIFLVIVANIVFDSTIYAKRWMTLVELKDVVGSYTTSEDGIKLNDAKFNYPFTKMRLTFTKTTTSLYSYMCVDYVEPNSLALEFSFRGDNPSFGDYLVNHTNVYKQIKNQGTLVSGNTYEYDLNVLCGTMGREFYASSWQKNFLPEQVEIYVDDNTIENQQFTIYFDANDGIIPSGGNMGNTPTGHITSLSGDQKKGSVVVTYGENAFSEMCADCPVREGYVFTGWFTSPSNGDPVYDATGVAVTEKYWEYLDDKFKWIGTSNIQLYAHWKNDISPTMHPGTLPGIFSVSDTTQIYFSQGNLQFRKSSFFPHKCADGTVQNGTWRFAENQYDNVGEQNINTSASYSKWIDMFGWGTSGWSGTGAMAYQPYSTSSKSSDYYQGIIRDSYRFADWGVYNAIVNGGNEPEQWRCPTIQELDYLFYKRQNASSLYAAGRIDTINGLILLPDNWQTPATLVFKPSIISFLDNVYTLEEWKQMENAGAVFLPATGYYVREQALKARNVGCWYVSSDTLHYSTTGHSPAMIRFTEDSLNLYAGHGYWGGRSVRLVKDVIKGSGEGSIPTIEKDTCNVRVTISIDNLPRTLCTDISKYTDKDIIKGEKRFSIPITSIAYKLGTIYGLNYINIVPISPSGKCYGYISDCYANRGTYYDRSSHWTYGHTVTKDGYVFFDLQSIEKGVWTLTCVQKHAGTWLYNYEQIHLSYSAQENYSCGSIAISDEIDNHVTITAIPVINGNFVKWNDEKIDNPRVITITKDTSFTAYFNPGIHNPCQTIIDTISATICRGDSYDFNGQKIYLEGTYVDSLKTICDFDSVVILNLRVAQPNSGMVMDTIYEGETYYFGSQKLTQQGMYTETFHSIFGCDSTVTLVLFVLPQPSYIIDGLSNNIRFGSVQGSGTYTRNTEAMLTARPNENYYFVRWSDGNTDNPRHVMVTKDSSFTAFFAIKRYNLNAESNDPMLGTVSGGGEYLKNEVATLMANPYSGNVFVQWEDGDISNPRSVQIMSDTTFIAFFETERPVTPIHEADTMIFTAADTTLLAVRVYSTIDIEPYDKFIVATIDNHNIMGPQINHYREAINYTPGMNVEEVSIVEVFPTDDYYRLHVKEGFLAPGGQNRNALYSENIGADWMFAQYETVILPQAVHYNNRMILYNELAPRFSSYRQVTGLDRHQTTIFKLLAHRNIPQEPIELGVDSTLLSEYDEVVDDIPTEVLPSDNSALISTSYIEFAFSFSVIIWLDAKHTQCFAILTFSGMGQLIATTYPHAIRRALLGDEISFEINSLLPATTYYYTLMACDDDGSILKTVNGSFTTTQNSLQSITDREDTEANNIQKIFKDNNFYILRNGKIYTFTGTEIQ